MCVATIANCFAPHTSCSLRKITHARLCDAQQCASSHVTFGILNMLVVVRSAPYLYLRIEGDPCMDRAVSLAISYIYLPDHRQVRST